MKWSPLEVKQLPLATCFFVAVILSLTGLNQSWDGTDPDEINIPLVLASF